MINLEVLMERGKSETARKPRDSRIALINNPPVMKVAKSLVVNFVLSMGYTLLVTVSHIVLSFHSSPTPAYQVFETGVPVTTLVERFITSTLC